MAAHYGTVSIHFVIGTLPQDQQAALRHLKATNPTGIREIECEELNVVSDAWLAGNRFHDGIGFQIGIGFAHGRQSSIGRTGGIVLILVQRQDHESGPKAVKRSSPAGSSPTSFSRVQFPGNRKRIPDFSKDSITSRSSE